MATIEVLPPKASTLCTTNADHYIGVHRIFCVGQNYAEHVAEMGGDPKENPPIFFIVPILRDFLRYELAVEILISICFAKSDAFITLAFFM